MTCGPEERKGKKVAYCNYTRVWAIVGTSSYWAKFGK
jgi:hypothetical protein